MATKRQAATKTRTRGTRRRGAIVGSLLVATVRLTLDSKNRVDVQSAGDLIVVVRADEAQVHQWTTDALDPKGRCAEQLASALKNLYSRWFTAEQSEVISTYLKSAASSEIVVGLAPLIRIQDGRQRDPAYLAKLWRSQWRRDWDQAELHPVKSLLHHWILGDVNCDQLAIGDAVLTRGGESWPDRLVTAYQGKNRKTEIEQEGRLPPIPDALPAELATAEQALAYLEARFSDLASPEWRAVRLLRSEFERLLASAQESSIREANALDKQEKPGSELSTSSDAARIAAMPDRAFFQQFNRLKNRSSRPELKALLASFLRNQAGRDFHEIADASKRFQHKKEFAEQVRACAQFIHCKFRIEGSNEIGNLTFGKSGTSATGQFKIYRKAAGKKTSIQLTSDFPRLGLADA